MFPSCSRLKSSSPSFSNSNRSKGSIFLTFPQKVQYHQGRVSVKSDDEGLEYRMTSHIKELATDESSNFHSLEDDDDEEKGEDEVDRDEALQLRLIRLLRSFPCLLFCSLKLFRSAGLSDATRLSPFCQEKVHG